MLYHKSSFRKNWHVEFVKKTNLKPVNSETNLNLQNLHSIYRYNVQLHEITLIYVNQIPPMWSSIIIKYLQHLNLTIHMNRKQV